MKTNAPIRENLTMAPMNRMFEQLGRANRVLARVRHRQLELALEGRAADSARYARRACKVRRQLHQAHNCACHAA